MYHMTLQYEVFVVVFQGEVWGALVHGAEDGLSTHTHGGKLGML